MSYFRSRRLHRDYGDDLATPAEQFTGNRHDPTVGPYLRSLSAESAGQHRWRARLRGAGRLTICGVAIGLVAAAVGIGIVAVLRL